MKIIRTIVIIILIVLVIRWVYEPYLRPMFPKLYFETTE